MAIGGLITCPRCKQPVRDADWLQGVCTQCGLDFARMDPDYLADEMEQQRESTSQYRYTRKFAAVFTVGATVMAGVALVFSLSKMPVFRGVPLSFPLLQKFLNYLPFGFFFGLVAAFGAWLSLRRKRASDEPIHRTYLVAFAGGIGVIFLVAAVVALTAFIAGRK